jgi:hypothetical protein
MFALHNCDSVDWKEHVRYSEVTRAPGFIPRNVNEIIIQNFDRLCNNGVFTAISIQVKERRTRTPAAFID